LVGLHPGEGGRGCLASTPAISSFEKKRFFSIFKLKNVQCGNISHYSACGINYRFVTNKYLKAQNLRVNGILQIVLNGEKKST
jgi:hypothetical protein